MSALARLAPDSEHVVHPGTGELILAADAPTETLVEIRDALAQLDYERKAALGTVDAVIIARVDEAERSGELDSREFTLGDWRVRVDPPTKRTVDYTAARAELLGLARRGEIVLDSQAIENAFAAKTTYTLRKRIWNALVQHAPEIERVLDEYAEPARRYVKVGRWRAPAIESTAEEEL